MWCACVCMFVCMVCMKGKFRLMLAELLVYAVGKMEIYANKYSTKLHCLVWILAARPKILSFFLQNGTVALEMHQHTVNQLF